MVMNIEKLDAKCPTRFEMRTSVKPIKTISTFLSNNLIWSIVNVIFACSQRSRLCAVGELTNCPPGTVAKFITKSRS